MIKLYQRCINCVNGTGSAQKTSAMTYGSDGLRRRMTTTNADGSQVRTDYVLDGQSVVAETIQNRASSGGTWSNPVTVSYLMGPRGPMYRKPGATSTDVRWYLYDGLGNVVGEVNVSGIVTGARKFDVYGATRATVPSPMSKHGWQGGVGHSSDDETGLVYMRARHYDPQAGRFASEDRALDGDNWFSYCAGDPINSADPTGLATLQQQVQVAAIAGGMGAGGGGAAMAVKQNLAQKLGEMVAFNQLRICQWLEGANQYVEGRTTSITDFTLRVTRNGIEVTSEQGFPSRTVFIDIANRWGAKSASHIQKIHLDFQHEGWSPEACWEQISLQMNSFPGWKGP